MEYIEIKSSHIKIQLENIFGRDAELKELTKKYGLWDPVRRRYENLIMFFDYDKNYITLPRGAGPYDVSNIFGINAITDNTFKKLYKPQNVSFKTNCEARNNLQSECLDFLLERNEYSKVSNPTKLVGLGTGKGKTFISLKYLSVIGEVSMIIVDRLVISDNWLREIAKLTNLKEKDICVIKDSKHIKKLLDTDGHKYSIFIVCHKTLQSYFNNGNSLQELFKHLKVGCKIYDEAHIEFKNIMTIECNSNVSKTIFLTATPNRSNFMEDVLYSKAFKYVVKFFDPNETNVKNLYHKVLSVSINSEPTFADEIDCENKNYGFSLANYSNYIEHKRFDYYINSIKKIIDMSRKKSPPKITAIILGSLSLIDKMYESLSNHYKDLKVVRISSKTDKETKKLIINNQLKYDIIISTEKTFQKSLNILELECMINLVPISSETVITQLMGRLRGINGCKSIFVDVCDTGFSKCNSSYKYREKTYKIRAKKIYKMKL